MSTEPTPSIENGKLPPSSSRSDEPALHLAAFALNTARGPEHYARLCSALRNQGIDPEQVPHRRAFRDQEPS